MYKEFVKRSFAANWLLPHLEAAAAWLVSDACVCLATPVRFTGLGKVRTFPGLRWRSSQFQQSQARRRDHQLAFARRYAIPGSFCFLVMTIKVVRECSAIMMKQFRQFFR